MSEIIDHIFLWKSWKKKVIITRDLLTWDHRQYHKRKDAGDENKGVGAAGRRWHWWQCVAGRQPAASPRWRRHCCRELRFHFSSFLPPLAVSPINKKNQWAKKETRRGKKPLVLQNSRRRTERGSNLRSHMAHERRKPWEVQPDEPSSDDRFTLWGPFLLPRTRRVVSRYNSLDRR